MSSTTTSRIKMSSVSMMLSFFSDPDQRFGSVSEANALPGSRAQLLLVGDELPHAVDAVTIKELSGPDQLTCFHLHVNGELPERTCALTARRCRRSAGEEGALFACAVLDLNKE
jgi:hypothetical protein